VTKAQIKLSLASLQPYLQKYPEIPPLPETGIRLYETYLLIHARNVVNASKAMFTWRQRRIRSLLAAYCAPDVVVRSRRGRFSSCRRPDIHTGSTQRYCILSPTMMNCVTRVGRKHYLSYSNHLASEPHSLTERRSCLRRDSRFRRRTAEALESSGAVAWRGEVAECASGARQEPQRFMASSTCDLLADPRQLSFCNATICSTGQSHV
jgi:hypothetical protein